MTTTKKFEKFHADNPAVYEALVFLAREYLARTGDRKLGTRALWERLRWQLAVTTEREDRFKLNDHLIPFYTRLIMKQEPDLAGVFDVRSSEADAWIAGLAA